MVRYLLGTSDLTEATQRLSLTPRNVKPFRVLALLDGDGFLVRVLGSFCTSN